MTGSVGLHDLCMIASASPMARSADLLDRKLLIRRPCRRLCIAEGKSVANKSDALVRAAHHPPSDVNATDEIIKGELCKRLELAQHLHGTGASVRCAMQGLCVTRGAVQA